MYVYVCIKIKLGTSVQPSCTDVLPKQLRKQSLKIYTWVTSSCTTTRKRPKDVFFWKGLDLDIQHLDIRTQHMNVSGNTTF